ncbi:glycine betaine/L-proline ABC transporter ATP-binding protein [Mesorhizobium sp.]|uniref:quaternary amine ABC transporter ATP-binding protein n=1 Tax=Mesorhizobium sp. TaxID=1871066 RepID=UPI0012027766|nr:glycine betaine/L-proline ABC transporter ATP-binding protein [Mesorhizobium sp.]TIO08765.1 MAG: glycine betaine/L-proline ABC transporter ATP-binding protein [Mesorhizobium sp.]TIO36284.1 MAG: glycine betaine/L-proline ABC transporter ATP-binding protein [Mesorhizobium sp.]TIP09331.1 MAG: glycine betaine/L-proline ABC transporter ATP-binding protein [Mesorhizobium sp.]
MADTTEQVQQAAGPPRDARPIKLACRNVWKLFGANAVNFIRQRDGKASMTDVAAAGLVGAVRAVDLEIRQGEIFIIMGLSGSGKSTLVRCMSRLVEPTHGKVEFEGKDLLKISDAALIELRRHRMGMVFQNFALLPHLNVLENIAFPLGIQGQDRPTREKRAREVIELVGLRGREHFYPRELSGGQQQRVGIARSLATKPEIWFLDEPFSALDPLIRREMQDELMRLQTMLHKTIVFITHDFDEAIRLADRIAIMKDGEVIQIGTPEELVVNPATDYVAEFTRDVDRAKVISARSLMRACDGTEHGGVVAPDAKIASFSADIVSVGKPFAVVNGAGKPIGEVTPQAVIDLLAGIERSGAGA